MIGVEWTDEGRDDATSQENEILVSTFHLPFREMHPKQQIQQTEIEFQ